MPPSVVNTPSYCEQGTRSPPHSGTVTVEDLTSRSKLDRSTVGHGAGDGRDVVKANMDLLRVDVSPRQASDAAAYSVNSWVTLGCR